eukprot:773569_1
MSPRIVYYVYICFLIQLATCSIKNEPKQKNKLCPANVPFKTEKDAEEWLDIWTDRLNKFWRGDPEFKNEFAVWGDCKAPGFKIDPDDEYLRTKTDPKKFKGVQCNINSKQMEYPSFIIKTKCHGQLDLLKSVVGVY